MWRRSFLFSVVLALIVSSAQAAKMNVVVILDGSGSMGEHMKGGEKMNVAKQALLSVLATIPADTNVGIMCFSGNTSGWIYNLQPLKYQEAGNAINRVWSGGSTPLGHYMTMGADALLEQRKKERYGIYRMLVVTDGEATDDAETPLTGPGGILEKGITLTAIGVNMRSSHSLATKVPYRSATNPEGLKTAIAEVFAETPAQAGDDDYAMLAGLNDQVAASILKALATVDNAPIGQRTEVAASGQPVYDQQGQPRTVVAKPLAKGGSGWVWWFVGGVLAVIAVFWVFSRIND